jgi:hypothetical protein
MSSPEDVPHALAADPAAQVSDQRLLELGYKPEFRREMSLFGVLGISFCAIGILTGMSSAFQTGLFSGGPVGPCPSPNLNLEVTEFIHHLQDYFGAGMYTHTSIDRVILD